MESPGRPCGHGGAIDGLTDEELYDELVAALADEGVRATAGPGRSSVRIHRGWSLGDDAPERFDPPLELHVDPHALGRHLRGIAADAQEAMGGSSPMRAAMSLLLVHLEETVETRPGRRRLRLGPGGVDAL
ncbi:hypothetical protein [Nocardiopsis sp. NRRL B-16309]|uniref:hypothetical protein n=1 Tax=Nocardiopsis sp. NRRL B-16309 TaxID=1519494 RepID=UPI0006AED0AA|nr:hypothetical protein [Nocardiopsis sp. NRRL B-16309]KOX10016.1 hypothetical protein ADL05_25145 [Nocardiopsis sp. NRRL B-16309]